MEYSENEIAMYNYLAKFKWLRLDILIKIFSLFKRFFFVLNISELICKYTQQKNYLLLRFINYIIIIIETGFFCWIFLLFFLV